MEREGLRQDRTIRKRAGQGKKEREESRRCYLDGTGSSGMKQDRTVEGGTEKDRTRREEKKANEAGLDR